MMKATILLASAVIYLWTVHLGQVAAERGLAKIKNLYTSQITHTAAVLTSNPQAQAPNNLLSK